MDKLARNLKELGTQRFLNLARVVKYIYHVWRHIYNIEAQLSMFNFSTKFTIFEMFSFGNIDEEETILDVNLISAEDHEHLEFHYLSKFYGTKKTSKISNAPFIEISQTIHPKQQNSVLFKIFINDKRIIEIPIKNPKTYSIGFGAKKLKCKLEKVNIFCTYKLQFWLKLESLFKK